MFKNKNRKTRARCKICSKLTVKIPERRQDAIGCYSDVFIVNFEHISHLAVEFLLFTLRGKCPLGCMTSVIAKVALYSIASSFHKKIHFKVGHRCICIINRGLKKV